jgi:hypothetical protein
MANRMSNQGEVCIAKCPHCKGCVVIDPSYAGHAGGKVEMTCTYCTPPGATELERYRMDIYSLRAINRGYQVILHSPEEKHIIVAQSLGVMLDWLNAHFPGRVSRYLPITHPFGAGTPWTGQEPDILVWLR